MRSISEIGVKKTARPIKVLQFGEGNFLRCFVDEMIDIANEKNVFNGNIVIVKPRETGDVERFKDQDSIYTVTLRGKQNGVVVDESRLITSVEKTLHCLTDYDEYMSLVELDDLRFVVSNTTEAGIVFDSDDKYDGLPKTFPGKLTKFLFERFNFFGADKDKGLIIFPLELIENNGSELKRCVLKYAELWCLPDDFKRWIEESNTFCNTLVDRIVTGYPKNDAELLFEKTGYEDPLLCVGEPYALWVIQSENDISDEFTLADAGLPVVFTDNIDQYRECKVRILNGAHTSSVLLGYLCGFDIVRDCVNDGLFGSFMRSVVTAEIVPFVPLEKQVAVSFANDVFERFGNPFIDHSLLAISLNSVSKWKTRVLPSFKDNFNKIGVCPEKLTLSFAALLSFYRSTDLRKDGIHSRRSNGDEYLICDNMAVLKFFAEHSCSSTVEYVTAVASNTEFWGEDLSKYEGFVTDVSKWVDLIESDPLMTVRKVMD